MRPLFLAAIATLTACGPLTFSTEMKGEAVIEGSMLGQVFNVFPQLGGFASIDFDQNQDFKNNNTSRDKVKSLKLTSIKLRIISPPSQDYGFLDSVEFAVKAGDKEQKIASKTGVAALALAAPNPTLTLDVVDAELVDFVHAASMTLITRGAGRQPPQETRLEATVKFLVGVGL